MAISTTVLMAFALWALTGCVVGWIFGVIIGTGKRGGFLGYVLLGIIGAMLSGLLFRLFGNGSTLNSWQANIMTAAVGALILVVFAEYAQRHRVGTKTRK